MSEPWIVSAVRTPVGRAYKGSLRATRPDDLAALVAERIRAGGAEVIMAGGTESMSMVPMGGNKISPNPWLVDNYPDAYINTGLGTENIARKFGITREAADAFAANSHKKAVAAIATGAFADETVAVEVKNTFLPMNGNGNLTPAPLNAKGAAPNSQTQNKATTETFTFDKDELPRADTSVEVLAGLKPAFHVAGSVTAGNSSPMSDGAAAAGGMGEAGAGARGLKPLGGFVADAPAGCRPEDFGMGRGYAFP